MPTTSSYPSIGRLRWFVSKHRPGAFRVLGSLGIISAITFLGFDILHLSGIIAGFFYMIAIVVIAGTWGFWEATSASCAALLCFDYFFLPPVGMLNISGPEDWEAFAAFLAVAIAASCLSARSAARHPSAAGQREMERLYALSRAILLMDVSRPVAKQIAYQIAQIFQFSAVALYDRLRGEILRAGPEDLAAVDDKLRQAAVHGALLHDEEGQVVVTAIRLGGEPIGSVALRGAPLSDGALHALSNLVAIGLERVRGQEAANRAEAARQSQELKSTLMDAIAHEFKTPLTSMKAAATALLSGSVQQWLGQRELVSIVDEEVDRLERLVNEAIQMARLEGGRVQVVRSLSPVEALVRTALRQIEAMTAGREVRVLIAEDTPPVSVDAELMTLAIRQVLDNALKYSPLGSPLTVRAQVAEGNVVLSVADQGNGIAQAEQASIFEKFYRAPSNREQVTGTGMGLAIARRILEAHSGRIWVQSNPGKGSEFFMSFPVSQQETVV